MTRFDLKWDLDSLYPGGSASEEFEELLGRCESGIESCDRTIEALTGGPGDAWAEAVRKAGYRAVYCPVGEDADDSEIKAYAHAARQADITIAEVGVWNNPLSPDEQTREKALKKCKKSLVLAEKIGAKCCVNISGSRGEKWDGPHPDNFTTETFDLIVESVRNIIDDVKPSRSFYTLETMPWMYPDSADSYLDLVKAIDRTGFAVHLDPVNLICSPQKYFGNIALIRECFEKLGPYIKSCHAKDIILEEQLTVHLNEVRPGLGGVDYKVLLAEMNKLDTIMPLMLEHLDAEEDYRLAANYILTKAKD